MKIEVLKFTEKPLSTIGECASECYQTEMKDEGHARRIAEHCILSGHGRNEEFPDLTVVISGISARMARELYTHIIGTTRVQASTRYIDYDSFVYYVPTEIIQNTEALKVYIETMNAIKEGQKKLSDMGFENDTTGYMLPLAMDTVVVLKINARALGHLSEMRFCTRALREFRNFMAEFKKVVSGIDEEWKWIADNLMKSRCAKIGYCVESKGEWKKCQARPHKSEIEIVVRK